MATVNVILPDGNTFTTATVTEIAAGGAAAEHVHDATDQHEAIHVDNNEVVVDGHQDQIIAITKTLNNDQSFIQCKDEAGDLKFKVTGAGEAEAKVMVATDILATQYVVAPGIRATTILESEGKLLVKSTLPFGEKYIDCQLDTGASIFSVDSDGVMRGQSVAVSMEVSGLSMTTGILTVNGDCTVTGMLQTLAKPDFQTGFKVPRTIDVVYDSIGEANNADTSRIVMTKTIYVQPALNSNIPPTLNTSGSIAISGAGKMGYIPSHPNGQVIPGTEYDIGRATQIGDQTHDNDGIRLRKRMMSEDSVERNHTVLICPDSTDPNILVYSRKDDGANYLQFVNVGPDVIGTNENIVFRVTKHGDIQSQQVNEISSLVMESQQKVTVLEQQLEEHMEIINAHLLRLDAIEQRLDVLETVLLG